MTILFQKTFQNGLSSTGSIIDMFKLKIGDKIACQEISSSIDFIYVLYPTSIAILWPLK